MLEFRRKTSFSSKRKWRNALISTIAFFSFSLIFLPAPFVLSVTTANCIFFLRQGCRGKLFDAGYVERSSQRAAKAGRIWDDVMLVKAQSLKLNSAERLFSSFRQPPKMLKRTNMAWKQIIKVTTLFWSFSKCVCCYYSCKVAAPVRNYISRVP